MKNEYSSAQAVCGESHTYGFKKGAVEQSIVPILHQEDLQFERPEFRPSQSSANYWIDIANRRFPEVERRAWCYFPRFEDCVAIPKVDWWSYRNSHMFREVVV